MITTETDFLFTNLAGAPVGSSQEDQARSAKIDLANLRKALMPDSSNVVPTQLVFNLFDDLVVHLQTAYIEPFDKDGIAWRGNFPGVSDVRGYLAVTGLRASDTTTPITLSGHVVSGGARLHN